MSKKTRLESFEDSVRRDGGKLDAGFYCLKTIGSRFDATAAESLRSYGIEVLHLRIKKPVNSQYGKDHKQTVAMFPGYLIAKLDPRYFRSLGYVHGVASLVGQGGMPEAIPSGVIEEIKGRIGDDGYVQLKPLAPGDRVEITDGPLCGLTGAFVEGLSNDQRLKILLDAVDGSMWQSKAEVPREMVARLQAA